MAKHLRMILDTFNLVNSNYNVLTRCDFYKIFVENMQEIMGICVNVCKEKAHNNSSENKEEE